MPWRCEFGCILYLHKPITHSLFFNMSGHGFIPDVIVPEDYVLGGFSKSPYDVLELDGQWDGALDYSDLQAKNGLETMNCTSYGTLNCLELLYIRKFGTKQDYSERYVGVVAETAPSGNSPKKVIDTIRKICGLLDEIRLPFGPEINTWDGYYSPNPMTQEYLMAGLNWLKGHTINYEWVFTGGENKQEKLMEAIKYSPVGASVFAWKERNGLFYKEFGESDNHWISIYGYEKDKSWKVLDSYDNTLKKLEWNYDFGYAMRYSLTKIETESKRPWYINLWEYLKAVFT